MSKTTIQMTTAISWLQSYH